jgi:thioesterase domain-containing protein
MQRVRASAYLALTRYRPRFYAGEIQFVRAAISSCFPADPVAVWDPLTQKIEVTTVPGDHLGMIATHYEDLAAVLSRFITKAF